MKVTLVSKTSPEASGLTAEGFIVYCARVSSPRNQTNLDTAPRLLKYLIKNRHWSPFEMASMCLEVETSRAIAAQILRHRSASFQEFSQRYSEVSELGNLFEFPELRLKNPAGNRQGSSTLVAGEDATRRVEECLRLADETYRYLLDSGVAPECARMVLPLCTKTRMYFSGTVRTWIHYLESRCDEHAQKEHRDLALAARSIFVREFPVTSEALGWV